MNQHSLKLAALPFLYPRNLYRITVSENVSEQTKRVLVFTPVLKAEDRAYWDKIRAACGLCEVDVALCYDEKAVQDMAIYKMIIIFGAMPLCFLKDLPLEHFIEMKRGEQIILTAPGLSDIAANKTYRTALWQVLKKIFNIK